MINWCARGEKRSLDLRRLHEEEEPSLLYLMGNLFNYENSAGSSAGLGGLRFPAFFFPVHVPPRLAECKRKNKTKNKPAVTVAEDKGSKQRMEPANEREVCATHKSMPMPWGGTEGSAGGGVRCV